MTQGITQTTEQLARKLGQLQSQLQRLPSAPIAEPRNEQERQRVQLQRQELSQLHVYTRRFAQEVLHDLSQYLDQ